MDDFPQAIRYASMEEMLKDPEVELVVVVTPAKSHATLCIQALDAGKNGEASCLHLVVMSPKLILLQ